MPRVATNVWVTHCDRVEVTAMAFDGARSLWTVDIGSVRRLELADSAFGWSDNGGGQPAAHHYQGLTVTVTNVTTVPEVPSYAFRGRLRSVTFDRVRIDAIRPFAFGSLTGTTSRVEFRDTVFGHVEQQAFKKFTVNEFVVKGCRFEGPAPSRMLTEITVHDELRLDGVQFAAVRSYAFRVHGPKVFRVHNSRAECVQSYAFEVRCRGPAFVEDSAFGRLERGAFAAVVVDARRVADDDYQEFVFENNTVAEFEDDALAFDTTGFRPRVDRLIVGRTCGCPARWRTDLLAFSTDYPLHTERPVRLAEHAVWCARPDGGGGDDPDDGLINARLYDEAHCTAGGVGGLRGPGAGLARFLLTAACLAAAAAVVGAFVYWACRYRNRKRGRRWTNVPTSSPSSSSSPQQLKTRSILKSGGDGGDDDGGRRVMVMPEGKTYRETELHVIVERADAADNNRNRYQYRSTVNYHRDQKRGAALQPLTSDL